MEDALPYQDKAFLYLEYCADQEVCSHFLPEEAAAPWEDATCSKCETNWSTRLQEVLVKTVDGYTTPYPCISADGNKAHIVPYMYQLCPHCNGTKLKHIAQLVTDLATVLVKSNVLEVKVASVARTALNFDARLFISATA